MSDRELLKVMEPLKWLNGSWQGHGTGGFPTMDSFEFKDQMSFGILPELFEAEGLIHFQEIAWVIEKGKPSFKHWETGLFRPLKDNCLELQVTHNTGRIEVLKGTFEELNLSRQEFRINFDSTFLRNADGLVKATSSKRIWIFEGQKLFCQQYMSTVEVLDMTPHLSLTLDKEFD